MITVIDDSGGFISVALNELKDHDSNPFDFFVEYKRGKGTIFTPLFFLLLIESFGIL